MVSTTGWKGAWPYRQQGVSEGNGHGQEVGRCPKPNRRVSPGVQTGEVQNEITAEPGNPQANSQGILPEGSSEKENPLRTQGVGGQVQAGSVRSRGMEQTALCSDSLESQRVRGRLHRLSWDLYRKTQAPPPQAFEVRLFRGGDPV